MVQEAPQSKVGVLWMARGNVALAQVSEQVLFPLDEGSASCGQGLLTTCLYKCSFMETVTLTHLLFISGRCCATYLARAINKILQTGRLK